MFARTKLGVYAMHGVQQGCAERNFLSDFLVLLFFSFFGKNDKNLDDRRHFLLKRVDRREEVSRPAWLKETIQFTL